MQSPEGEFVTYSVFHRYNWFLFYYSSFVIVSTLDGKVTALDKHNGEFVWSFDAEIGPLLSSSLAKISMKQVGPLRYVIFIVDP